MKSVKFQVVAALLSLAAVLPAQARADQWAPTNIRAMVAGIKKEAVAKAAASAQAKPVLVSAAGGVSCNISNPGVMRNYGLWYYQHNSYADVKDWNKVHDAMLKVIRGLKATGFTIIAANIYGGSMGDGYGGVNSNTGKVTFNQVVTKDQVEGDHIDSLRYVIDYTVSLTTLAKICGK